MSEIAPSGDGSGASLPAAGGQPSTGGDGGSNGVLASREYKLRKYLLLLATVVATVTYTAGFSPPGGVWDETDPAGGYLAGDPIIRHTSYHRYSVFFYLDTAAFACSLVVIVLVLSLSLRHERKKPEEGERKKRELKLERRMSVLRGFMVLDLLSIVGAYTAGIYRKREVPVYTMGLAVLTIVYVFVFHMVMPLYWWWKEKEEKKKNPEGEQMQQEQKQKDKGDSKGRRKVLMLLTTFAVSVTYIAGLSAPPGGFSDDDKGGHRPGDPALLGGTHQTRLRIFVNLNSTAFFWSLIVTVQLLEKKMRKAYGFRLLDASIVFALLGLVGAYATGSSRDVNATCYTIILCGAAAAFTILLRVHRPTTTSAAAAPPPPPPPPTTTTTTTTTAAAPPTPPPPPTSGVEQALEKAHSLILLLATLATTITYQAGLDPPGGVWQKDGSGYKAGDPILQTRNRSRYNAFFYCNSGAFVASLVVIAIILVRMKVHMLKSSPTVTTHALLVAMILDLFSLIGAYAAGSCRDVSSSIYSTALAGAILIYVVIHVLLFTLELAEHHHLIRRGHGSDNDHPQVSEDNLSKDEGGLEKRRKRLLLFAVLAATIAYQAGLTPPSGFWLQDDNDLGHHAGDPILLSNSPFRYKAFFYCNSVSFMLSIALILLLVNPNLYRPATRSYALSVCTAAGTCSLVGAYAAGSTQYLITSIKTLVLVAAILIIAVVFLYFANRSSKGDTSENTNESNINGGNNDRLEDGDATVDNKKKDKRHSERKQLMLLGILAASVTYQAGLEPPGGVWQDDDGSLGQVVAGNPIMGDIRRTRYLAFSYINSTSFVASVIVIILLLLEQLPLDKSKKYHLWTLWSPSAMNTAVVLDMLGLLVAYAIGSTRSWEHIGYVFTLVFSVLAYIVVHVTLHELRRTMKQKKGLNRNSKVSLGAGHC